MAIAAIHSSITPLSDPYTEQPTVFLSCAKCALSPDWIVINCLHTILAPQIMAWRIADCRAIVATRGDCVTCSNPIKDGFETTLSQINQKLSERDMGEIRLHWLDEYSWQGHISAAKSRTEDEKGTKASQTNETNTKPPINAARRRLFRLG